jgi:hypothetical protein
VFVAAGVVAGGAEPAALAAAADVDAVRGAERFVELGVTSVGEAIEVGAVGFGALRATDAATDALDGVVGVEGSVTLKPAPDGLRLRAALAGVVVDAATFTDAQAPAAGVIQPQVSVQASYTPTNQPFGVTLRVWGGLPHNRLALAEVQDASLCPEQAGDPPRGGACSGVPAFAIVDVGAYVRLGQFRLDVSGVNALDVEGRYRGAALPVGGATVRARLSLFF